MCPRCNDRLATHRVISRRGDSSEFCPNCAREIVQELIGGGQVVPNDAPNSSLAESWDAATESPPPPRGQMIYATVDELIKRNDAQAEQIAKLTDAVDFLVGLFTSPWYPTQLDPRTKAHLDLIKENLRG
jgi:hypothetical protein